jgi:SAM-dependent methyltransferase
VNPSKPQISRGLVPSRWQPAPAHLPSGRPYCAFAQHYDALQSCASRECWAAGILAEIRRLGHKEGLVLDAGAGTGIGARLLKQLGTFSVISCDSSAVMLNYARSVSSATWQADLADLPTVKARFRLVVSGFDALNYLPAQSLEPFFRWVRKHLEESDGALIFDYSTTRFLRDVWGKREYTEHNSGLDLHWKHQYEARTRTAKIELTCSAGGRVLWTEEHCQYSLDSPQLVKLAVRAGLRMESYRDLHGTGPSCTSQKDVYVMKR